MQPQPCSSRFSKTGATAAATLILAAAAPSAQQNTGQNLPPLDPISVLEGRVRHSVDVPQEQTDFDGVVRVPAFDPGLGFLRRIEATLSVKAFGSASAENLSSVPSNATIVFASSIVVSRPDGSLFVGASPTLSFTDALGAFDEAIDYAGSSGVAHMNLAVPDRGENVITAATELDMFTGRDDQTVILNLPIFAQNTSRPDDSGDLDTKFLQTFSGTLTLVYHYEVDCNGNGVPDIVDVASGTSNDENLNELPDECEPSTMRFCFGDGTQNGGPDCLCGNSAPGNMGGCLNSTGVGARLDVNGVPSIDNDTLLLFATDLPPGKPTFYLQGTGIANNGQGTWFESGLLCVWGSITRIAKVQSAPEGGGPVPFPAVGDPPISTQLDLHPGLTRTYQVWYREPNGPCPGQTVNTTNGIKVVWGL